MNVICFGDSNTYGYDPRSYFGGRYDADNRWAVSYTHLDVYKRQGIALNLLENLK